MSVLLGETFFVNETLDGQQFFPAIAALANGGFVATWSTSDPSAPSQVRARLFNPDGSPAGDELFVNTVTEAQHLEAVVTGLSDGRFVVAWVSNVIDGPTDILGRLFNADGSPVGDEFVINSTTDGLQVEPSIAALPGGGFVVAYDSFDLPSAPDMRARIFDANGAPVGDDFVVNSTTNSS